MFTTTVIEDLYERASVLIENGRDATDILTLIDALEDELYA